MKKTSLYLEPWVDIELRRLAEAEGKSKAQVIREALATRAMEAPPQPKIKSIGVFKGPGDLSRNVDRYLEGFGED
jgi:Ribbon-helix-helix protein, copG family